MKKKTHASSRSAGRGTTKKSNTVEPKWITAEEFDAMHDAGVDMTPYVDWSKARRPGREVQRVNVDFPADRRLFQLEPKTYSQFTAALDKPPAVNPRLRRLLASRAPWEQRG